MELYFKDLESEDGATDVSLNFAGNPGDDGADARSDAAEDVAFAELAERVSAARLVY
jgi:hypothetical protein